MAYGSLFSDNQLPKINGTRINSIYGKMETAHRTDQILSDAYDRKPDYYLLVTDERDYKDGKWINKPNIMTRELPVEIAAFFGPQEMNGEKVYVTRMYIRTSGSGNGSFIDQTLDFSGSCGALGKTISYYRLKRWDNSYKLSIFKGEELGEKIESVFSGKSYKVEALPNDFDYEYPCSYVRAEGGLNYPDRKLTGWRRPYEMPYIKNSHDKKHIRVFMEDLNAHVYLEEVEPNKGDTDLIKVQFSREYDSSIKGNKGDYFCNVVTWSSSKTEAPGEIIRYNILKVDKDKYGTTVKTAAMLNDKVQFKRDEWASGFYRLIKFATI